MEDSKIRKFRELRTELSRITSELEGLLGRSELKERSARQVRPYIGAAMRKAEMAMFAVTAVLRRASGGHR